MSNSAEIKFRNGKTLVGWQATATLLFIWSLPFWIGLFLGLALR